jgi:hypothetical protein
MSTALHDLLAMIVNMPCKAQQKPSPVASQVLHLLNTRTSTLSPAGHWAPRATHVPLDPLLYS